MDLLHLRQKGPMMAVLLSNSLACCCQEFVFASDDAASQELPKPEVTSNPRPPSSLLLEPGDLLHEVAEAVLDLASFTGAEGRGFRPGL